MSGSKTGTGAASPQRGSRRSGAAERRGPAAGRKAGSSGGRIRAPSVDGRPRPNALIRFLGGLCRDHPVDEKIFVVPTFSIGRQIGEALARSGQAWANLRFVTLPALAHESAALDLARLGISPASETELVVIVDTILRDLKALGRLEYFAHLDPRPGLARALHRAIQSLRLAGIKSRDLDPRAFTTPSKGRDMVLLLECYEKGLASRRLLDLAGLCELGRAALGSRTDSRPEAFYLALEDWGPRRIERDFLESLAGPRLRLVPADPVSGLERPRLYWGHSPGPERFPRKPESDAERLPWLFGPQEGPPPAGDGSLAMFRAVGSVNECREVLRRVLAGGIRFDKIEIVCPANSRYPAIFHLLAERAGLPVTFSDGVPMVFTSPGRVFSGLADWFGNDFPVVDLCRLIEAGDLKLPSADPAPGPSSQSLCRHLRRAAIGWGRERYAGRLLALEKSYQEKPQTDLHGQDPEAVASRQDTLRSSLAELRRLKRDVEYLLGLFPEVECVRDVRRVDFQALCAALSSAVASCIRSASDLDAKAAESLRAELPRISGGDDDAAPRGTVEVGDALDRLRTLASSLTVGASSPLPGHLHVSSSRTGGFSGRPVTYIVGLDENAFPGRGPQDPILLDGERERISKDLPVAADELKASLYAVAGLLASLRGKVTFSYAAYDVLEGRPRFPSSLLLQVHRLAAGDVGLDYTGLESAFEEQARSCGRADPAGFIPQTPEAALDETDWWLGRVVGPGSACDSRPALLAQFPELRAGVAAEEARKSERLSAYDGVVRLDSRLNPLENPAVVMSASRLEFLAKCPYGFFLRYILGLEPPDDLTLDRSAWLDPMERGSLIHEALCDFMTEVTRRGARVATPRHAPLMNEIAARILAKWRVEIPPPSEGIYEKEARDIMDNLGIFLQVEARRPPNIEPFVFEKRFDGVTIEAGRGSTFRLRGVIDRIDRTGPGLYRIVDYKTGGTASFENLVEFGRGRIIQHALYTLAAEAILSPEADGAPARVTESGYSFPTRRGEGREIMVEAFDRSRFRALLGDLFQLIARGYFVTGAKENCHFCDFSDLCGDAAEDVKSRLDANPDISEALDRLKRYE